MDEVAVLLVAIVDCSGCDKIVFVVVFDVFLVLRITRRDGSSFGVFLLYFLRPLGTNGFVMTCVALFVVASLGEVIDSVEVTFVAFVTFVTFVVRSEEHTS